MGSIKDLFHREYKTLVAVNKVNFSIDRGEIVGFIGPNGAGKSTTIKMLTGILKPTGGDMRVLGLHPFRDRKRYVQHIGVVFGQRTQLWWDIAVIESLNLLAHIYGVPWNTHKKRIDQLTDILDLKEVLHQPVRKLSLGQRLRSDLAASLVHGPELLFLDEPTIGVDAVAKRSIRQFLRTINEEFRTTIILTTHDLVEIEELCERIIIIDKGAIAYDGALEKIRNLPGLERTLVVDFGASIEGGAVQQRFAGRADVTIDAGRAHFRYNPASLQTVELIKEVVSTFPVADLSVAEPSIEDVLVRIYKQGISPSMSAAQ